MFGNVGSETPATRRRRIPEDSSPQLYLCDSLQYHSSLHRPYCVWLCGEQSSQCRSCSVPNVSRPTARSVTRRAATLDTLQHCKNVTSLGYVQRRSCSAEHNTRPFVFLDSATKSSCGNLLSPSSASKVDDTVTTFTTKFGTHRQDCTTSESTSPTAASAPLNPVSVNITAVAVSGCKAQHCH